MTRLKQTPRNPNINRPKAAMGCDLQSTKGRPTPRPALSRTPVKGGKQPQKHLSQKLLCLGATPTGGIKKTHHYRPGMVALREIRRYQKSTESLIKRSPLSKINTGDITRVSYMAPGSWNSLNAGEIPIYCHSSSSGGC